MAKYLLDASAIYPLVLKLREKLLLYTSSFAVLDLTFYEVGNAIWKEYRRGRIKNPLKTAILFKEVLGAVQVVSIEGAIDKVAELAINENLTFYDASYLYVARSRGYRLVTEDKELKKYPESISTEQLLAELS
ncbi:type II toxin-antitoxin system VapC family toxin [Pyrofollis japonicus]|uniref:type II toxin-antitoxin system VapC family toxin n=1 Tax=Pyrofollis japonicus TaxID=3060460 RepID=UPI00295BFE56|nr:type II toxin-antitoxin system VapC family toxin [Pyrofollis japonicus]BEP18343.1 type II toxin-antitoxin system VapC family toxin [Pyrofollis japonicus]